MPRIPLTFHFGKSTTPDGLFDVNEGTVIGFGKYVVGALGTLEFLQPVIGQDIVLSNQHAHGVWGASSLLLDDPDHFYSHVDLTYKTPPPGAPAAEQSNI